MTTDTSVQENPRRHRTTRALERTVLVALHTWVLDDGAERVAAAVGVHASTLRRVVCGGPCQQLSARSIDAAVRARVAA
jgi:hypothetical protein